MTDPTDPTNTIPTDPADPIEPRQAQYTTDNPAVTVTPIDVGPSHRPMPPQAEKGKAHPHKEP